MKKKILFIGVVGLIFSFGFAQKEMSKAQFESIPKSQQELYLKVKQADDLATARITNYLAVHGEQKRVLKRNGRTLVLSDIVNGEPLYMSTNNIASALGTNTHHLQVGGSLGLDLDGGGRIVGIWDDGPLQLSHPEYQNETDTASRMINIEALNIEGTGDILFHGTHVAGTIGAKGVNPQSKGMATGVFLRTWNFLNPLVEMVTAFSNPASPIYISNHSYGAGVDQPFYSNNTWRIGAYSGNAISVDDIARENPNHLSVWAAGNDGLETYEGNGLGFGLDKLTGYQTAKNNLVVANAQTTVEVNPFTGEETRSFVISLSSSQGPTNDLRIKPDIAGDGTAVFSTGLNSGYLTISGTSMASPNVAGTLVLLQEYYEQLNGKEMNSSTLRGLVIHTATDDAGTIGPDPRFGWGLLNAKLAAEVLTASSNGFAIIEELTLTNNNTYTRDFAVGAQTGNKLIASICWTDVSGTSGTEENANDTTVKSLVNDLDIRLTKDGVEYLPWRLEYNGTNVLGAKGDNNSDNIERIDIDVPEPGNYTLIVSHKGALQGAGAFDLQEQDFSLILTGANLTLSTTDVALSNSLRIHPNPSKGEFTISFDAGSSIQNDVKVQIYDLSGRQVFNMNFDNASQFFSETINLNNVQSGIYMANISQGNNVTSRKIIIE